MFVPLLRQLVQSIDTGSLLLGGGKAAQGNQIDSLDLAPRVRSGLVAYSSGEVLGKLMDHTVVHQVQCLCGDRGVTALDAVGVHLGEVEVLQVRGYLFTELLDVNKSPPTARGPDGRHEPIATRLDRIGGPEPGLVQTIRDQEQRVVERLGVQADKGHAGIESIARVKLFDV